MAQRQAVGSAAAARWQAGRVGMRGDTLLLGQRKAQPLLHRPLIGGGGMPSGSREGWPSAAAAAAAVGPSAARHGPRAALCARSLVLRWQGAEAAGPRLLCARKLFPRPGTPALFTG